MAVVVPCYNARAWLDLSLGSILRQTYPYLSLIVVDDGSTDGSAGIARSFGDRVTLISGPNRGANHARNRGLEIARASGAEFIVFLDADDYHEGEVLRGAVQMAMATGADMVLTEMQVEYPDRSRLRYPPRPGQTTPRMFFEDWMYGHFFHPGAILWRIAFLDRLTGWDEDLVQSQDTDFCLNAMFAAPLIRGNDLGISVYTQVNQSSLSRAGSPKANDDRIRVRSQLLRRMPGTPLEPCRSLLMGKLYIVTRNAFRAGQIEQGRRGLAELRTLGFRDNPGSPGHRLVSNLIGLEAKVRIWGN